MFEAPAPKLNNPKDKRSIIFSIFQKFELN